MSVEVIWRLHEHRIWADTQLLKACEPLSEEQLRQSFEIGQGSIWRSLLHMYAAEYVWLEALSGNPQAVLPGDIAGKLPGNQEGTGGVSSIVDLKTNWNSLHERWRAWLKHLSEPMLTEIVFRQSLKGRFGTPALDVLLHVCTHSHYTTAQVMNMLRKSGVQPLPDPMLITLSRQEMALRDDGTGRHGAT